LPVPVVPPPITDPTNPTTPIVDDYTFDMDIWFAGMGGGISTIPATIPDIPITYGGGTNRSYTGPVQTGLQEEDSKANYAMANADTTASNVDLGALGSLIVPPTIIDLGGIDYGEFSAINNMLPYGGSVPGGGELNYISARTITYKEMDIDATTGKMTANANADIYETVSGSGIQYAFADEAPPASIGDNFDYEISIDRGNLIATTLPTPRPPVSNTKTYLANTMTVYHFANSNLTNTVFRGATVTNADRRTTKGDYYIPLLY